jgi:DNA-binding winged helix-turn-helix (wHTH) protein
MSSEIKGLYVFGRFRMNRSERALTCDGAPVDLAPKLFDTLIVFIERPGRLISKAELTQALWPDTFVAESALTKNISDLRKALGDGKECGTLIETVPKSGYRFVASVEFAATAEDLPAIPAARNRRWAIVLAAALVLSAAGTGLALWARARTAAMASWSG